MNGPLLNYMVRKQTKLPRKNYLDLTYMGRPPKKLSAEQECELPKQFQLQSFRGTTN
jgi:hypothetical protein